VVPLVKATQEQQSEIEKLKTENNALKKRLERLENMMSKK
jgi:cell division protein FtsB